MRARSRARISSRSSATAFIRLFSWLPASIGMAMATKVVNTAIAMTTLAATAGDTPMSANISILVCTFRFGCAF